MLLKLQLIFGHCMYTSYFIYFQKHSFFNFLGCTRKSFKHTGLVNFSRCIDPFLARRCLEGISQLWLGT